MSNSDDIQIEIINWKKYNLRATSRNINPYWFAFGNKFLGDRAFDSFSHEEKLCWVYLLCYCSQKNRNPFILNLSCFTMDAKLSREIVVSCIKKLVREHIVTSNRRLRSAGKALEKRPTITIQEQYITPIVPLKGDPSWLINLYNSTRGKMVEFKGRDPKRLQKIARAAPALEPAQWEALFAAAAKDKFYIGVNDRGWKANLDYFCRPGKASELHDRLTERGEHGKQYRDVTEDLRSKLGIPGSNQIPDGSS